MMFPYVIRAGDHLHALAFRFGFDPDAVWNDAKNEDLRKARGDGHILEPGDILYVPRPPSSTLPVNAGAKNVYVVAVPTVKLSVAFLWKGRPLANAPYILRELPEEKGKSTDGNGTLTVDVPVTYKSVTVDFAEPPLSQVLRIGHLDPVSSRSGISQRLANLGHLRTIDTHVGSPDQQELRAAVRRFQWAQGLPVTGEIDGTTRATLEKVHGS